MNKWTFFKIEMQFRQHLDPNPYLYSNSDSETGLDIKIIQVECLPIKIQTYEQRLYLGPSTTVHCTTCIIVCKDRCEVKTCDFLSLKKMM
jgi:hypothetical protein